MALFTLEIQLVIMVYNTIPKKGKQHSTEQGYATQYQTRVYNAEPNKGIQHSSDQGYKTQFRTRVYNTEP